MNNFVKLSSALVVMFITLMGAYLALDRRVTALASTTLTTTQVEHLIDLKTTDKLDEIIRRLQGIDARLDRLQIAQQAARILTKGQDQ